MKYGVITRNLTDLGAGPDFRSERKSQLLFGEPIEVGQTRKGYCKVYQADGYNGWVDEKSVHLPGKKKHADYIKKLNYHVTSITARIARFEKGQSVLPPFLFYGTRVHIIDKIGNYGEAVSPDGAIFRISLKCLSRLPELTSIEFHRRIIIREAKKFLGTPYLWGGTSPYGFDCSGLVQRVFGMVGIKLPRDSKDQRKIGYKIGANEIQQGDLLFFTGHIAIAIDKYRIIHSSLGEGGVAINSLNPDKPGFREDLHNTFLEARRVII